MHVTLLRTRDLAKSYGKVRALDGVSFEIGEGITGLLGSNGAGKTTSLKLFMGLIDPDGGSVEVLGHDTRASPEFRARIGYAPEHDCLPAEVSAAEFLAYMAEVSGLPRTAARLRASDLLRHVGLFEERYRPMGTYSTGMKQRVKLAQALVHDPVLAFLDEPTAGLDPLGRREMLELIRRVGREFGISIVISTHLMGDVERTCDSVVVLDRGQGAAHRRRVGADRGDRDACWSSSSRAPPSWPKRSRRRGLAAAARRQPADARERRRARTTTRSATRSWRRTRCSTGSRRRGISLADVFDARAGGRGIVTAGSGEVFDLGYQRLRGQAHEAAGRAGARSGATACGSRSDSAAASARSSRPWLLIGLALVPILVLVVLAAFVGPAPNARRLQAAQLRRLLRVRHRPARPVRRGRRAAARLPGPARRRALALRGAADHASGLRRVALGRVPHRPRARGLGARGDALRLEPARRHQPRLVAGRDNWDVVPRFLAAGAIVAVVLSRRSRCSSRRSRRGARTRRSRCSPCSSSAPRSAASREDNFYGNVSRHALPREPSAGATRHRALDLRRHDRRAPAPGWVSVLWLLGLTTVLGLGLLRRTERMVRG